MYKINSQLYANLIPSDFESMITHQVSIPLILNKQTCIKIKSIRLLMHRVLSLDTGSIRYLISSLGSKDIFHYLKNQQSNLGIKPLQTLNIEIKY